MKSIDLNCDMGELRELADDGTQELLLASVSSVNICCGAYAGDEELIEETIWAAVRRGVSVGAHPGYPDRANFGRIRMDLSPSELTGLVLEQLRYFDELCSRCGAIVCHVKPHGALYNTAAADETVAAALADAVARWRRNVTVYALAGAATNFLYADRGLTLVEEAFADRTYQADGRLRPRSLSGALISDPELAARQALSLARQEKAGTICIHSDTPGAANVARAVRRRLADAGIGVSSHSFRFP